MIYSRSLRNGEGHPVFEKIHDSAFRSVQRWIMEGIILDVPIRGQFIHDSTLLSAFAK